MAQLPCFECGHSCAYCGIRKAYRLVLLSIFGILSFITSLLISLLQFANYAIFYNFNRNIQRYINSCLQDLLLSQFTTLVELHCGVRMRVFFADKKTREKYAKEHSLVIGNHPFQIDAIFYWLYSEMFNALGSSKAFLKDDLRQMPVLGWAFRFGEFILLKRNWQEDQKSIGPGLDRFMEYDFPFVLLILPEGTRFTVEKHRASQTFAEENNIPYSFKYHLLPRVKGFNYTLQHLRSHYSTENFGVYHIELVQRSGSNDVTIKNFIKGQPFSVDVYIERIESSELPGPDDSTEKYGKFLYEIFQKKDQLRAEYERYGVFPGGYTRVKKLSISRLLRFLFLNVGISGGIVFYLIYLAFVTHSLLLRYFIYSIIIIAYAGIFMIINYMQYSKYGVKSNKNKTSVSKSNEQAATISEPSVSSST